MISFIDYGDASNKGEEPTDSDALFSVGVGFMWSYREIVEVDLVIAHAINEPKDVADKNLQDDGVHFQVKLNVF